VDIQRLPYPFVLENLMAGEHEGGIMSFVGAHMDVVTANPETWSFSPFELTRDGVSREPLRDLI
jgi:hypothetical protein